VTGLAVLDATIRPVDALATAGIGWLTGHVQPLQDVVDRMAGKSTAIQTFSDGWTKAAAGVDQVRQQLEQATINAWEGNSAERYQRHAAGVADALHDLATQSANLGETARTTGEAAAEARQQAGDLLTDLVRRLIDYVTRATAAEGGVTADVMSTAASMVDGAREPMAEIEQTLRGTIADAERRLNGTVRVASAGDLPTMSASIMSNFGNLKEQLNRTPDVTLAQQIIQLPPPRLPADARPLSKARLNELAQNPIFFGKLGLNVTIGDYAEDAARAAFGLKPNEQKFYPYANSPNWWEQRRAVIPDAVLPIEDKIVTMSDKPGIPASVEKHRLDNGFMVEVKATSGPITLDEPRQQLQKYIDYLSNAHDAALPNDPDTPKPTLLYIATSEAQIDPAALAYADERGVAIWRAQMYETGTATDPHIAVDAPQAQNDTARQKLDGLVVSPVMTPAPLFNSPYDELMRRNQQQNELR